MLNHLVSTDVLPMLTYFQVVNDNNEVTGMLTRKDLMVMCMIEPDFAQSDKET